VEQRPTLPPGFSFPLMAKASRGGYDGKGTVPVADQQALESLLDHVLPSDWILEEMVPFEQELALVACRDRQGNVACWPLVQTHQHQQICDWVVLPAPVNQAVQAFARNVAASLLTGLDYVGVLAIEFFYGPAGLQVNEIAPRTHNSGHVTIEACRCSQFAQQVRIVAGLPMGSTDSRVPGALMVNLLGLEQEFSEQEQRERLAALAALPGAHLHWYGKAQAAPGRKLGHLTLVLEGSSSADRQGERDRLLAEVRRIWPLPEAIEPPKNPLE
jgi:5-(carboxyamino)imidazole ribonucleotide synthase